MALGVLLVLMDLVVDAASEAGLSIGDSLRIILCNVSDVGNTAAR